MIKKIWKILDLVLTIPAIIFSVLSILFVFLAIYAFSIQSSIDNRRLKKSTSYDTFKIIKIDSALTGRGGYYGELQVMERVFVLNDSTQFPFDNKYSVGQSVKRYYYLNENNKKVYSDIYSLNEEPSIFNGVVSTALFYVYSLFFLFYNLSLFFKTNSVLNKKLEKYRNTTFEIRLKNFISTYLVTILTCIFSVALIAVSFMNYFSVKDNESFTLTKVFLFSLFGFGFPLSINTIILKRNHRYIKKLRHYLSIFFACFTIVTFSISLVEYIISNSLEEISVFRMFGFAVDVLDNLFSY